MTKILLVVAAVGTALLGLFWAGYAKLRHQERFDADGNDLEIDLSFLTACPHLLGGGVGELNVTLDKGLGTVPRHR